MSWWLQLATRRRVNCTMYMVAIDKLHLKYNTITCQGTPPNPIGHYPSHTNAPAHKSLQRLNPVIHPNPHIRMETTSNKGVNADS
jgi:hypothetical protein